MFSPKPGVGEQPMIVRSSFKCSTCGQVHTVRIGMGLETRQSHRFPCVNCGEDMVVALNVDYQAITHWTEAVENAELAAEEVGAPIMNVDANFLVPESERHKDLAFPRMTQHRAMIEVAEKQGSLVSLVELQILLLRQRLKLIERPPREDVIPVCQNIDR
jgi:predicted RNA-binding Zn-ribbon protein involved in translation (DUF1610 family)